MFSSFVRDSGATYRSLVFPARRSSRTSSTCWRESEEFRKWAMLPEPHSKPLSRSTWFFISAMRGEITIAVPSMRRAGS